jgi:hypothetical protein
MAKRHGRKRTDNLEEKDEQKSSRTRRTRRSSKESSKDVKTKNGWNSYLKAKEDLEEASSFDAPRDFWLKDGESAPIQFLDAEPINFQVHFIQDKKGNWKVETCQLEAQKYCVMCQDGLHQVFQGAFKILDYRGSWDKKRMEFKYDEPVEKLWMMNMTLLQQLHGITTKRGKALDDMVLEVTRTGKNKKTTYNFERAYDEEDEIMEPIEFESDFPSTEDCIAPKSDKALARMGFDVPEDEEDED